MNQLEVIKAFRGDRQTKSNDNKNKGMDEHGERLKETKGGVATYVNENVEALEVKKDSIGGCELLIIDIKEINVINIIVYRPPRTYKTAFEKVVKEIDTALQEMESRQENRTIFMSGDFNFPFITWKRDTEDDYRWEEKECNSGSQEKEQFEMLNELSNKYQLTQIVTEETRGKNTLDLVYTNETKTVNEVTTIKTHYSDHKRIEIETTIKVKERMNGKITREMEENKFKELNIWSEEINWEAIGVRLEQIQWEKTNGITNSKNMLENLVDIIYELCQEGIKKKKKGGGGVPMKIKKKIGRIKKLRRKMKNKRCNKNVVEEEIVKLEKEIQEIKNEMSREAEEIAIENMIKNPKYLYALINKRNKKNRTNEIGPLEVEGKTFNKGEEVANRLTDEYSSEFTEKEVKRNEKGEIINGREEIERLFDKEEDGELTDITIEEKDIKDAIDSMDENSSAGPDGVPAYILKKLRDYLAKPLKLIFRKSLDEGKLPEMFKMAYITPIHKGGSRKKPGNYRPVSLTSHIMKVFEKIIKKNIVEYLEEKERFNKNQFGFMKGRGTQTQLLKHYDDIYEAMKERRRMDTVYLDFAKAFDKVDHEILMRKVKESGIGGKLGKWLVEFLWDRKFQVIANGCKSRIEKVTSGVPQGTVLAALLFIIMISDIDKDIIESIVRSFADDTRVNRVIRNKKDIKGLKEDLIRIYRWAEVNKMKFNEKKFEQISHGESPGIEVINYNNPKGEKIEIKNEIKDLGVIVGNDFRYKTHIERISRVGRIKCKQILREISTRKKKPMMRLFNAHVKSILEYCNTVWCPSEIGLIEEIESVQRYFTSKIEELKDYDYHGRLKEGRMYSLQRRRERRDAIWAWKMVNGIGENIFEYRFRKVKYEGTKHEFKIENPNIKTWWTEEGKRERVGDAEVNKIERGAKVRMAKVFNSLPYEVRSYKGETVEGFKTTLDKWLDKEVPDQPKLNGLYTAAKDNTIKCQNEMWRLQGGVSVYRN